MKDHEEFWRRQHILKSENIQDMRRRQTSIFHEGCLLQKTEQKFHIALNVAIHQEDNKQFSC